MTVEKKMEPYIEGNDLDVEIKRTDSDVVVYRPQFEGMASGDNGNEHFLVFESKKSGDLLAIWTQSTYEGSKDHRLLFARSKDRGATWLPTRKIVGPGKPGEGHMASWGFPIVADNGRIYCIYNQFQGITDRSPQLTGTMDCVYSDDDGESWSEPETIAMPRSSRDHKDSMHPANWIVWQKPILNAKGRWIVGFTRWSSPTESRKPPIPSWTNWDAACEVMRFENIHLAPEPRDIEISYPLLHHQLRVPAPLDELVSIAQEPSLVLLPDGRLFMTMRTFTGFIWYSVSDDDGDTWRKPDVLRQTDDGEPLLQPLCCCPIYPLQDGRFLLLYHNNNGYFEGFRPEDTLRNRRPAYLALGEFRPGARQPVWFSRPKFFMDSGGHPLGPLQRTEIGIYTSFTDLDGKKVLWHPDRKFFLLGKYVTDEWLSDLSVPENRQG